MNKLKSFQEILSVGYIYLIAIGILSETFYYKQIGVNILSYSGILDVLMSPIAKLTSSITTLIVFFVVLFLVFQLPRFLVKKRAKNWFQKSFKLDENATNAQVESSLLKTFLFLLSVSLFGFFIGTGIGQGFKLADKIENDEIKYTDHVTFIDGEKINVRIVGVNSSYLFYLKKDNKTVQIAPIGGVVKSIENQ
ncbi:hypothetical protein [uncultured Kordia sp.]|uniref:hypothetical protein n=1 Tax=uncultured Kordia sp. TaxID=507699 RepID=UPI002621969E|nr:hypothetical protein [uncultured Kordia sp.]